jgi:hypothetical protein
MQKHHLNISVYLILTLITCGIYNLYWNYKQQQACNQLVRKEEFNFLTWLILIICTCGLYHLYYQYKMGEVIMQIQSDKNLIVKTNLPIVSLILSLIGLSIVADIIHQSEINKIVS